MTYGTAYDGSTLYCYELNDKQDTYLNDILKYEDDYDIGHAVNMKIRSVISQGYYFEEDISWLNGLKVYIKLKYYVR